MADGPHRSAGGDAAGHPEKLFELEGEPERVIRAGEAFWEPGGEPMLTLVDDDELSRRKDRRAPRG